VVWLFSTTAVMLKSIKAEQQAGTRAGVAAQPA